MTVIFVIYVQSGICLVKFRSAHASLFRRGSNCRSGVYECPATRILADNCIAFYLDVDAVFLNLGSKQGITQIVRDA
jgi:hypothetical protein